MEQRVEQNEPGIFVDSKKEQERPLITNVFGQATVIAVSFKTANQDTGYWLCSYWPHYAQDQLQDLKTTLDMITASYPSADIQVAIFMIEKDVYFLPDYSYQRHLKAMCHVCSSYTPHGPRIITYILEDYPAAPYGEMYISLYSHASKGTLLKSWTGSWIMGQEAVLL